MERHLLKEMGFICHVEHPHKFIPMYLQQLDVEDPAVQQEAWSLANDRWAAERYDSTAAYCSQSQTR